jgi:hypothetical protein
LIDAARSLRSTQVKEPVLRRRIGSAEHNVFAQVDPMDTFASFGGKPHQRETFPAKRHGPVSLLPPIEFDGPVPNVLQASFHNQLATRIGTKTYNQTCALTGSRPAIAMRTKLRISIDGNSGARFAIGSQSDLKLEGSPHELREQLICSWLGVLAVGHGTYGEAAGRAALTFLENVRGRA